MVETRAVLAAAYRGRMNTTLTHSVEIDRKGHELRVLCGRVLLDHLADAHALSLEKRQGRPTCKSCLRRWTADR